MTTTFTEGRRAGEFLMDPAAGLRSIDNLILASGTHYTAGTVLGKFTSGGNSGKYGAYNNHATDGTQAAIGIVLQDVDATAAQQLAAVVVRDCEVNGHCLTTAGSPSDVTAAFADLTALGIIVRL